MRCKKVEIAANQNKITAAKRTAMWINSAETMLKESRDEKERRARGEEIPTRDTILGIPMPHPDKAMGKSHYQKTALKTLAKTQKDAHKLFLEQEEQLGISRSVPRVTVRPKACAKKLSKSAIPRLKVAAAAVSRAMEVTAAAKKRRLADASLGGGTM